MSDKFAPPSEDIVGHLRAATELLRAFRAIEPTMPTSYAAAFLAVALDPGKGTVHYAKVLGVVQPVASRHLLEIGQKTRTNEPGLGLVASEYDKVDLRLKRYFLTAKGNALLSQIEAAMSRRRATAA